MGSDFYDGTNKKTGYSNNL